MARLGALLATLALAAIPLAGCGSGDAAKVANLGQPVAEAAQATTAAGSATMTLHGSVQVGGLRAPIDGSGAIDFSRPFLRMRIHTSAAGVGDVTVDEIVDRTVAYVGMDQLAQLPGGKRWLKVDLGQLAKKQGINPSQLQQLSGGVDPSQLVGYLAQTGDVRRVGAATIGGVRTTHYSALIDLGKLAAQGGKTLPGVQQLIDQAGLKQLPVDVWLDAQHRVRRERVAFSAQPAGAPAGGISTELTIDLGGYGTKVDTSTPPDDQVVDASKLLG